MSLNDIVQSAQGGEAVNNLASRFGLTPEQTQSAINALLPALEMGLQNRLQGGGLGSILGQLGGNATAGVAADDPSAMSQHGSSVLGDLFGGSHTNTQVAQQAATESGVPASVIQAMLPILASIVASGLFSSAQSSNWGGILSQMIGAATGGQGGLSSIFGQAAGNAGQGAAPAPGQSGDPGLGGLIGSVLGGLFGGGAQPATAPGASGGAAPSSGNATLDELSQMFQAGTTTSPEHQANLANIFGRN